MQGAINNKSTTPTYTTALKLAWAGGMTAQCQISEYRTL